ncbi:MAG: thioredoxin family protein [Bacteroidota bacterium]
MKKILFCLLILLSSYCAFSQDLSKFHLYKPEENAEKEISKAAKEAKAEGKHVFIQVGGNWCIWCARFNDVISNDTKIDSIIKSAYIVYHMNYSKENYNAKLLKKYGYPQRFGFPVFLILNGEGKLIHTQSSWYLEDGKKGYDRDKVISFFNDWAPGAFDPKNYSEK